MRYFFVVLFCAFTTSAAFAGEQFEVFGVHLDQEQNMIISTLRKRFDEQYVCDDQPMYSPMAGGKVFQCGGLRSLPIVLYHFKDKEEQLFFDCSVYGGCGGVDALEQVRRLLEERWNIKFIFNDATKQFEYETQSTKVQLEQRNLTISHRKKNNNNPSFD